MFVFQFGEKPCYSNNSNDTIRFRILLYSWIYTNRRKRKWWAGEKKRAAAVIVVIETVVVAAATAADVAVIIVDALKESLSMEQIRESKNRPTYLWSIDF